MSAVYVDGGDGDRGLLRSLRLRSRLGNMSMLVKSPAESLRNAGSAGTHQWQLEHILEPDVSDKERVLNLAKMSSDAYLFDDKASGWLNFSAGFNDSSN